MAQPPRHLIRRAWLRNAIRTANAADKYVLDVLEEINAALMSSGVQSGQILISTSEAGGSVSFSLPPGHTPLELAALNEEAIAMAQTLDPENPVLPPIRLVQRLRASFAKATI